jgi:glycosyltransferase involved in cell wall biosynthesis
LGTNSYSLPSNPENRTMARILVIASYTPSLIIFRGDMLRDFIARGHEVTCCSPSPDEGSLLQLKEIGVQHRTFRLQRTGLNPLADLRTARNLRDLMDEIRPDHVISYTIKPVIYGSLAAGARKVPHIHAMITGLGTTFIDKSLRGRLVGTYARFMYRVALKKCQTVFFQNPDDRNTFVTNSLVDPKKVVIINGSGINLDQFTPSQLPAGPPVFLLIARLIKDKGIEEFAAAARSVKTRFPEAIFRVVGFFEDHPRAISPQQMETWASEGHLDFLGFQDDVRPSLKDCTVYCLPSYSEGTPRTVLEAMAMGRPIITTDAPGCRETVIDGDNGFLVPVRDSAGLASAMIKFCEDEKLAERLGQRSLEMARQKYDVRKVNAAITAATGLDQPEV